VYMGHAYRGDQVNPDAHPPLVTAAEWHAANAAPVRAAPRGKKPNLLGGIARCATCRYVLAPGKSRFGGTGEDVLGYRCRGTHTAGVCPEPASINARKLETYVETVWRSQMADEAFVVQHDNKALQTASEALLTAEEELTVFASDLRLSRSS
ncbi:MAG TPA: recombinase zinc beta ribbon domain-containing protein, partial [Solirubrobacteraceae bacterium]